MRVDIAGVDEVGRGPLAGPVVAAAVILNPQKPISGIKDSKKLSPDRREQLYIKILDCSLDYAVGRAEVHEIDTTNILQASLLAMQRAVAKLSLKPDKILVDGRQCPAFPIPATAIVRGDQSEQCIAAASIVAKVTRDREMIQYEACYPGYGFAKNKGYGTKEHYQAINHLGVTPLHRHSFRLHRKN